MLIHKEKQDSRKRRVPMFKKSTISLLICFIIMFLLAGCNVSNYLGKSTGVSKNCPDAEIEWIDVLMINDIKYEHEFKESQIEVNIEKGKEIGQVTYQMADKACMDHQIENGHATFLPEGTPIFEVKGYPSSLMVFAEDRVFIVIENKLAHTVGDLYESEGLVKAIHVQSTEDGSRLYTFLEDYKNQFLEEWYSLKLGNIMDLHNDKKMEGTRVFLEIEFNNEISIRQVYWIETNTFNNGAIGNEAIRTIIVYEMNRNNQN